MAQPDRETVYAALFSLLQANLGSTFVTYSRRLVAITNAEAANMPALYQVEFGEDNKSLKGLPTVRKFQVHLVVYINYGSETSIVPTTTLNGLVTSIETAVSANLATGFQQLGIPVSSVQINGRIQYFEQVGTAGNLGCALVPIDILATY